MATIYNSELQKQLVNGARIQISRDKVPNEIAEKVVPTMEVNPLLTKSANYIRTATLTNATSATLAVLPASRDFYMTNLTMSYIKDATSTSVSMEIFGVIDGLSTSLVKMPSITLTAMSGSITLSYPRPVKLDKGSTMTLASSTNVANILISGTVTGYFDESTLA